MTTIRGLLFTAALGAAAVMAVGRAAAAAEAVSPVTAEQVRALVAEQHGKVVLVNFWATWCPPCLREFPDIIRVYEQYRENGVQVLAVSMNSPEEMEDVEEFLRTYSPPFPVYLAASADDAFHNGVLEGWYGEMPMTLVFNAAGENVSVHKKALSLEELTTEVTELLASR